MKMRKSVLAALLVTASAGIAMGAVEVRDDFSTNGAIVGMTPDVGTGVWAAHSGAGSRPMQVTGGALAVVQAATAGEDVHAAFANGAMGAGDVYYAGFDLTVADPGAAIASPTFFAHFLDGSANFTSRIWITTPTAGGYRLALSNDNSISDSDGEVFTSDLSFGVTYRIVSSYDYDNQSGRLWINPVNIASASIAATDPGFSYTAEAYAFRQNTGGNTTQVIDNLVVATTFAEAVNIPEPASLLPLGLVGLWAAARPHRRPAC